MGFLTDILGLSNSSYLPGQEIRDDQFLDKNGRYHMTEYLAYYEKSDGLSSSASDSALTDNFMTSFFTPTTFEAERSWEASHGLKSYKGGLKQYSVSPGIKRIGKCAFAYNLNLVSIDLPDGLVEIDKEAFSACTSLFTIKLPQSVVFIGRDAFDSCLEELFVNSITPPEISTLGISNKCRIIIPRAYKETYCSNRQWKRYRTQMVEL